MIDVCVTLSPEESQSENWKKLQEDLNNDPAVNLITGDAITGNTRDARKELYLSGASEFVSYVDPDDKITENAFSELHSFLDLPDPIIGIYTLRMIENERGIFPLTSPRPWSFDEHYLSHPGIVGQISIFRRDILEKVHNDPDFETLVPKIRGSDRAVSMLCAQYGDWKLIPKDYYTWVRGSKEPVESVYDFMSKLFPVYNKVNQIRIKDARAK